MAYDSTVYVDTAALSAWSSKFSNINEDAIEALESFRKNELLAGAFEGKCADAFETNVDEFMASCISSHREMKDVNTILKNIVEVMENE